ncbi:carbohydrate sulfotransferase 11 isoform X1 [Coccinella septempunctata]|uniref:carbohydrate sulfotransferase 11 isoform X1 n=1 Tax=Coccinella septempunctata TaxID=41139 RepID=UPI001D07B5CC|nr:carbohydrate sulfotransferase 11 isoform X1 [Coccinella septempunctata]
MIGFSDSHPWLEQISRQETLINGCSKIQPAEIEELKLSSLDHILVDQKHKFLYCYVPKVACTNWKRVMMVLTGSSNVTNLLEIPSNEAHSENSTLRLSQFPFKEATEYLKTYTTFMMVRHPMERLLSAFRNKFEGNLTSSKYFQRRYGRRIIKKYRLLGSKNYRKQEQSRRPLGSDVTLNEFVQYLINEGLKSNEHWTSIYDLCHPCKINYTFIGKYEHLTEDTESILSIIKAPPVKFPMTNSAHTKSKVREYFQMLPLKYMHSLYTLYRNDFLLFDYNLESVLGYDFG